MVCLTQKYLDDLQLQALIPTKPTRGTLWRWRVEGVGPAKRKMPATRFCGRIRYIQEDVERWLAEVAADCDGAQS